MPGLAETVDTVIDLIIGLTVAAFMIAALFYAAQRSGMENISKFLGPIETMWTPVVTIGLIGGIVSLLMFVRRIYKTKGAE